MRILFNFLVMFLIIIIIKVYTFEFNNIPIVTYISHVTAKILNNNNIFDKLLNYTRIVVGSSF